MRKIVLILFIFSFPLFLYGDKSEYRITSDSLVIEKNSGFQHFIGNVNVFYGDIVCRSDSIIVKNDTLFLYPVNVKKDSLIILSDRGKVKDSLYIFEGNVKVFDKDSIFADYMRSFYDSLFMKNVYTNKGDYRFYGDYLKGYDKIYRLYNNAYMFNSRKNDTVRSDTIVMIENKLIFKTNVNGKWGNGRFTGDSLYVDTTGYLVLFDGLFYTKRDSLIGDKMELFGDVNKIDSLYSNGNCHLVSIEKNGRHIIDANSIIFYFTSDSLRKIVFNGNIKGRYIKE